MKKLLALLVVFGSVSAFATQTCKVHRIEGEKTNVVSIIECSPSKTKILKNEGLLSHMSEVQVINEFEKNGFELRNTDKDDEGTNYIFVSK